MQSIALYSLKGGVGKTTLSVGLAWAAALRSSRRTLLWDLDPQAGATFLLGAEPGGSTEAQAVFTRQIEPARLVRPTAIPRLDLLPADVSLRGLDRFLFSLGKKKRLLKLIDVLGQDYDRILLDAPPGLTETSEQVLRAADLIVVPVIPSPLSQRALDEVVRYLDRHSLRRGAILPVYNMVDRRRSLHRDALDAHPDWPAIPMASAFEAMRAPVVGAAPLAPSSPAAVSLFALWAGIEKRLARIAKSG